MSVICHFHGYAKCTAERRTKRQLFPPEVRCQLHDAVTAANDSRNRNPGPNHYRGGMLGCHSGHGSSDYCHGLIDAGSISNNSPTGDHPTSESNQGDVSGVDLWVDCGNQPMVRRHYARAWPPRSFSRRIINFFDPLSLGECSH